MTRLTPEQIAEIKARHEYHDAGLDEGTRFTHEIAYSVHVDRERLLSHIESDGWQTMETAPRDGTPILVFCKKWEYDWEGKSVEDGIAVASYCGDMLSIDRTVYYTTYLLEPTHWRPLPAPPETKEG